MFTTNCRLAAVRSRRTKEVVAQYASLQSEQEQRILAAYSALAPGERATFDFDRLVLGVAATQAITEIAAGGSMLILVNVSFEVFLDRRRLDRYVAACQALDGRLRERLVLVLAAMPKGFPSARIQECVARLRPFCQGVGFQSDGMEAPVVELSVLGASIVVLQANRRTPPAPKELDKIHKLVESLHAYQARVLVRRVTTWQDVRQLARIGVDLIAMVDDERDANGT